MRTQWKQGVLWALLMGVLTVLFCLVLADGVLHMNGWSGGQNTLPGRIVFWVFLVGLPLLFWKKVQWRHTLINLALYFLLYFPVSAFFGGHHDHTFLEDLGGFIAFPAYFNAGLMTAIFWGVQSAVYAVGNVVSMIYKSFCE